MTPTELPTPREVINQNIMSSQMEVNDHMISISKLLYAAETFPVTYAIHKMGAKVLDQVLARLRQKGWDVHRVNDQRDGDYITIDNAAFHLKGTFLEQR